jgi:hypothetical protein
MDDTLAAPMTMPSCRSFTLLLLLASHQLFLMTMASHHRLGTQQHRTAAAS